MENKMDQAQLIEKVMAKVDAKMEKKGKPLKEKDKGRLEKVLRDIMENEKKPQEALGVTKKEMETMYAYAYNLFTHGKYKESRLMMQHLMQLDSEDPRYPLGCAVAFHQMKDYERAAAYYAHTAYLDKESPIPCYYMYDCFKNLNEPRSAFLMIESVISRCGDKEEHAILKERATQTLKSLYEEIMAKEKAASPEA